MASADSALLQLFPLVQSLTRDDKLRLIQLLAVDVANQDVDALQQDASYPVWTPLNAVDAAAAMLVELDRAEFKK